MQREPNLVSVSAQAIARQLADNRAKRAPFQIIEELAPRGTAFSYLVQDELVRACAAERRSSVAGYKIGLTSPSMQAMCGISEPIAGKILADTVYESGKTIAPDHGVHIGIEFEVALLIRSNVAAPLASVEESLRVIDGVAPALELVDDRGADYAELDAFSLIADNSWNAGIVLGEFTRKWPDLASLTGSAHSGDSAIGEGSGRDIMGHPCRSLMWLTEHLAGRGQVLRVGSIVLTGSMIRTHFPGSGEDIHFSIPGLGDVAAYVGN